MTADRIYSLLGSLPDWALPALRGAPAGPPPDAEAERFALLYSEVALGWKYCRCAAAHRLPAPMVLEEGDHVLFKAYLHLCNPERYGDRAIRRAIALTTPGMAHIASTLRTLLIAHDATIEAAAAATGLEYEVVEAYERLFFNVSDRRADTLYIQAIIYPRGRIVEYFDGYLRKASSEALMLRAGFNNGMRDVMHFAGLSRAGAIDINSVDAAKSLEGAMMTQGLVLASNGWLNQTRDNATIQNARQLISATKLGGQESGDFASDPSFLSSLLSDEIKNSGIRKMHERLRKNDAVLDATLVSSQAGSS